MITDRNLNSALSRNIMHEIRHHMNHIPKSRSLIHAVLTVSVIACAHSISQQSSLSPFEVVQKFHECYGTPCMDELMDLTTAQFRQERPKTVWLIEAWDALKKIKYEKVEHEVVKSKILKDRAKIACKTRIKTQSADAQQVEIFSLIKANDIWLIDDLDVVNEVLDLDKLEI